MLDFEVQRFTRVCAKTARQLMPGEVFFSYLVRQGGDTIRRDVAEDEWDGPPEDCLAWWKSEVPDPKSKKVHWAPHDVMLHYFGETEGKSDQADVRYILALLLIRRRIFREESSATDAEGRPILVVTCPLNESEYEVSVVEIGRERAVEVQGTISELLLDVGCP